VDFLPLAEETGFVVEIGKWIGKRAAQQSEMWRQNFRVTPDLWVSVNMSASGLNVPTLTGDVSEIVNSAGIDPANFVIEVTETMLLEDTPELTSSLHQLNGIGVRLSLDDFGSGFSSLAYLRRFPFDFIKIDTAFTADIPGSPRAMLLVEAIQNLATTTGISAIAEGIERPDQERALASKGWKLGQGYLYSKAVAPASFEALLAARVLGTHPGPPMSPVQE
jgi:EAL domain-containing protein (putative c-di-GMP-specific phosphodiesterase class I)